MQLGSWLQHRIRSPSAKQAWGLSPEREGWFLVGLAREPSRLLGVHTVQYLAGGLDDQGPLGVSHGLRRSGAARGALQGRHRVNMGLAMDQVVSGVLAIPVGLGRSDWEAEVQLEAARALGLGAQEVSFDWQAAMLNDGVVDQLHWVACAKDAVELYNQCVRRSGWQLASVEPVEQAAQRAASCLCGGLPTVLTRPLQDWQFDLMQLSNPDAQNAAIFLSPVFDPALYEALQTPVGPRLAAAGLALKAWT